MKTFRTTGTGNEQTISEIETDKIPLYPSEQDLLDDLANLEVGQIAGTIDPAESELIGVLIQRIQALENKLESDDVYSTDEVKTNKKWIDGKPIYKITLVNNSYSLSENSWNTLSTIFSNYASLSVDNIVSHELYYVSNSQNKRCNVNGDGINNEKIFISNIISPKSNSKVELTIEYTKTTD